jgi:hypothetical protein
MTSMRKNLVFVRAGDESLHLSWLNGTCDRNFDLFVSYYGSTPNKFRDNSDYYEQSEGLKYPEIFKCLLIKKKVFDVYEAFWFPDDDLLSDVESVNKMFDLFKEYNLFLAQPALGNGSYFSHEIATATPGSRLRFTNFVEIMCPLFNRISLTILGPTFGDSKSGWGLDAVWSHLLGNPKDRIAILDETPVIHSRPFKGGTFYDRCSEMGIDPGKEFNDVLKKHGLSGMPEIRVYGAFSL